LILLLTTAIDVVVGNAHPTKKLFDNRRLIEDSPEGYPTGDFREQPTTNTLA